MYTPRLYREEDREKIVEFLRQNEFVTLVAHDGEKPIASHLVVDVVEDGDQLFVNGHMSRANQLWRIFEHNAEVLLIFQGPHTYISASWYSHINVPTWNYQSVHVYGKPQLIIDNDAIHALLKQLMDKHETGSRYNMGTLPPEFVEKEMRGVAAFQVEVTRIEASYKLSQNRNDEDYWNIVSQLEHRGDEQSHAVAAAMKKQRPGRPAS